MFWLYILLAKKLTSLTFIDLPNEGVLLKEAFLHSIAQSLLSFHEKGEKIYTYIFFSFLFDFVLAYYKQTIHPITLKHKNEC